MKINYKHFEEAHNPDAAGRVLPLVFDLVKPNSVLDVGCANAGWLKVFKELGTTEVFGVDGIEINEENLHISKDEFMVQDLTNPIDLKMKFDLVVSLEVAEHLPENSADVFVSNLIAHGDIILFSAAIPNQGGQFHLNEQWPDYWNKKFKNQGFVAYDILRTKIWDDDQILWWYRQNMLFFVRKGNDIFKDFSSTVNVLPLIHPGLYRKKEFKPKFMPSRKIILKSIINHLKQFFKK